MRMKVLISGSIFTAFVLGAGWLNHNLEQTYLTPATPPIRTNRYEANSATEIQPHPLFLPREYIKIIPASQK